MSLNKEFFGDWTYWKMECIVMSQVFWSWISFSLSLGFKIQDDYVDCKVIISELSMYVQYVSPKNLVVTGICTHYSRSYYCHNKLFGHSRMSKKLN